MDILLLPFAASTSFFSSSSLRHPSPGIPRPSAARSAAPPSKSGSHPFPRLSANACAAFSTPASSSSAPSPLSASSLRVDALSPSAPSPCTRWVVAMEKLPKVGWSRADVIDYYVETLTRVLGSEKDAQMCIYDASWENYYGFCCVIDEESSRELARMPGVISVMPDRDEGSSKKDYSNSNLVPLTCNSNSSVLSMPADKNEYWLVQMEKPGVEVVTKAQMVDHYSHILTKVLGNEKDAQVCIYHVSWEKDFGFCCQLDEECARELTDVPGVLAVRPDRNFGSDNKDYRGDGSSLKSVEKDQLPDVKTKRLFVTGLSFYTSEKTLRAAFEGFGELVEVKIIMDKISKRSKGYAFIEYMTEEAAGAALKEMNGKIINGWMIVVDAARTNPPPKHSRGRLRPSSPSTSSY